MKILLTALFLLSTVVAQASYFQTYCSNGEGTVKTAMGHDPSFIKFTEKSYNDQGETIVIREYSRQDLNLNTENIIKIDNTYTTTCAPGSTSGYGEWTKVDSRKMTFTMVDGSAFPKNTMGLSKDGLSVVATVICEEYGNSRASCKL